MYINGVHNARSSSPSPVARRVTARRMTGAQKLKLLTKPTKVNEIQLQNHMYIVLNIDAKVKIA